MTAPESLQPAPPAASPMPPPPPSSNSVLSLLGPPL
jgi:hypothetical protein